MISNTHWWISDRLSAMTVMGGPLSELHHPRPNKPQRGAAGAHHQIDFDSVLVSSAIICMKNRRFSPLNGCNC
ncbi:MAG: hypothetical protein GPOALKHO_001743 [Sodalis sp.]|nr:MAG: hypothetical protein GPOALKHO_001743 [Sodalis sp.]